MYDIQCIKEYAYYISEAYCELDTLRYEAISMDNNTVTEFIANSWPVIQGSRNTRRIKEISRIPYDPTNVLYGSQLLNKEKKITLWNEFNVLKPEANKPILVWPSKRVVEWVNSFTHDGRSYEEGFYGGFDTVPLCKENCTHWMYVPEDPEL